MLGVELHYAEQCFQCFSCHVNKNDGGRILKAPFSPVQSHHHDHGDKHKDELIVQQREFFLCLQENVLLSAEEGVDPLNNTNCWGSLNAVKSFMMRP